MNQLFKDYRFILLLAIGTLSCTKSEIQKCDDSLSLYSRANFPIGVAIEPYDLVLGSRNKEIVDQQFNSITPENVFKPSYIHPSQNIFNWSQANEIVNYCLIQNKRLHGHTLLWHNQLPQWMWDFQGNNVEWEAMFKYHIQSICTHFRGKIAAWDVINEAFNKDGTLRNSIWKQHIGADYLEKAFLYAHQADPDALLFYNDYNLALNANKRRAVIALIKNLKQRNIPIHGIGLQMHMSVAHPSNKDIEMALKEFSELGLKIHLSEIDVSLNPSGSEEFQLTEELLKRQADKLAVVSHLYQQLPKNQQYGMTFWGHSDGHSWIRSFFNRRDYPLLFDDNYEAKPMYCKFLESL